ncbi:putative alpha-1,2-mannosidase [Nocardia tenerifensis]|uniref:Putative alpha-1,2-mannosidase n=1 Tax=Nocardia tenerifensis TaxID=228006 RepID=A0A318KDU7_9NOCA|nr:GH92 family glycosyl hydrolase [Nocardia tenerifensis]PXX57483.1 putative alpha-1,2-mannosidase [Nocardia tenerifensis]
MSRRRLACIVVPLLLPLIPVVAHAETVADSNKYVNPFVGTRDGGPDFGHGGGAGMTFPGAVTPFGMMQWSPDTVRTAGGGYKYEDNRLYGFSMSHISGPGCTGAQDFPVMPIAGTLGRSPAVDGAGYFQTFDHAKEQASPGYYRVTTDGGVQTELTASTRAGVARFTFPPGKPGTLLLDVTGSVNGVDDAEVTIDGNTVSGWALTGGFCGARTRYRVHFHATFDRPITASGTWHDDAVHPGTTNARGAAPSRRTNSGDIANNGRGTGAFLQFDSDQPVQMRAGLSYVSVEGARANLDAEIGAKNFDAVRADARESWRRRLDQIQVTGGDQDRLRTFYTALYHVFLQPYVFDDIDGRYTGFDGATHQVRPGHHYYATFSGWDIYRSEAQLLAWLAPDVASDIAQSMYDNAHVLGDVWDRWSHQNTITGVMNGDPYHSIVASAYAFGARDFDAAGALDSMVVGAQRIGEQAGYTERPNNDQYQRLGWVPGQVSDTLEYNIADFGISQLAQRLGNGAVAEKFLRSAHGWQHLFNPRTGWLQPRSAEGWFNPFFDPKDTNGYVEGNGAQYHWMTFGDVGALFGLMGGRAPAARRLDEFFTQLNAGPHAPFAYLGNEPTLQTPWLYAWAGLPSRTQDVVRRARTELFDPTPGGLVGNDDLGTMSAWYVWASLGIYPVIPGRAELFVHSPAFTMAEVRRSSGERFTICAPETGDAAPYIQALRVDGENTTKAWLPESFALSGGRLEFTMGAEPGPEFGTAEADAPPSFGVPAR